MSQVIMERVLVKGEYKVMPKVLTFIDPLEIKEAIMNHFKNRVIKKDGKELGQVLEIKNSGELVSNIFIDDVNVFNEQVISDINTFQDCFDRYQKSKISIIRTFVSELFPDKF